MWRLKVSETFHTELPVYINHPCNTKKNLHHKQQVKNSYMSVQPKARGRVQLLGSKLAAPGLVTNLPSPCLQTQTTDELE